MSTTCEKHFAAVDYTDARKQANIYENQIGTFLVYKETVGFVPNAIFVFTYTPLHTY